MGVVCVRANADKAAEWATEGAAEGATEGPVAAAIHANPGTGWHLSPVRFTAASLTWTLMP